MRRGDAYRVRTCAKINLHLAVGRRGRDGYHPVDTLLQTIDWGDDLPLAPGRPGEIALVVRGPAAVPPGEDNLVVRAARLWRDAGRHRTEVPTGLRFDLVKRLPAGAGLGGGSGDAAAALLLLERAHGRRGVPAPVRDRRLRGLARRLGADVPFFLHGGLARGVGRGDRVRRLAPLPDRAALVIVPPFRLATGEVYARFDRLAPGPGAALRAPRHDRLLRALRAADGPVDLRNDLERPAFRWHPELARAKRGLRSQGALLCGLSGSGSALFGLFASPGEARRLAAVWRARGWQARACRLLTGAAWRSRFAARSPTPRLSAGGRAG